MNTREKVGLGVFALFVLSVATSDGGVSGFADGTASPTPTIEPTPTVEPTVAPTVAPTPTPTVEPTVAPTPTVEPTVEPDTAFDFVCETADDVAGMAAALVDGLEAIEVQDQLALEDAGVAFATAGDPTMDLIDARAEVYDSAIEYELLLGSFMNAGATAFIQAIEAETWRAVDLSLWEQAAIAGDELLVAADDFVASYGVPIDGFCLTGGAGLSS